MVMGTQILIAESYQRWIYWVSPVNHEVTSTEMAEITSLLYSNKVVANKEFVLTSGTRLKIPQPSLYFSYIEKAVRAANPVVLTKDDIIFCLNDAEKLRWGNDISGSYRNYYYSYAYKSVRHIDNFSGEGKEVDFLFINGFPAIKCDCGNPIENKNPQPVEKEEIKQTPPQISETQPKTEPQIESQTQKSRVVKYDGICAPCYRPATRPSINFEKRSNPWKTVAVIGGVTVAIGTGYFLYALLHKVSHTTPPVGEPGGSPTGGGNPGGTPTGGPGGAPL